MTAHLQSAARAFEAVMRDLRPEHHWIGEVRPGQLDERAGNSAAAVRGDQAGAATPDPPTCRCPDDWRYDDGSVFCPQHQTKPDAPAVSPDERLREAATDT